MKYTSIIITNWSMNELRSKTMKTSFDSLLETVKDLPVEIIVINNSPEDKNDNDFFMDLVMKKKIVTYIINPANMGFGYARNQGIAMAKGEYIIIADNDIYYEKGWLEACIKVLEIYPDKKIYATPIPYPITRKHVMGTLDVEGVSYDLDMRAGSNCFVIRKSDLEIIGGFLNHRVAGTKWTNKAVRMGYLAAIAPGNLIKDLGFRQGYNLNAIVPIKRTLTNGQEIILNEDEGKV